MQSGTTGINATRIYSPTKQVLDQDPDGEFIRGWLPELAKVPGEFIAEPWFNAEDYSGTSWLPDRYGLPGSHCRSPQGLPGCPTASAHGQARRQGQRRFGSGF